MQVVHFTHGATDPLGDFGTEGAAFVTLADGEGDTRVSCIHLSAGSRISEPPVTHDSALLLVHGRLTFIAADTGMRLELLAGVGVVIRSGERYSLQSDEGAIVLAVEAERLDATARGISTPARIAGQRWPGDREETQPH